MADSATIVAASLDSSQLETSINKLVSMVAEKTKAMANNFTKEVGRMEQAVKNLGNIKIDSGGTADGGSSRRTSKQKEEETQVKATTQAYKEQSVSLDQLAFAQQKAIRLPSEMRIPDVAKSARESFQAFYKGFNEQARQIEPLIQSWEKLLQARHTGNIEQVAQKIAQVKHEIAELVKEQANLSKTKPQGYLDEIAKRNPQIKALREQLISLETEHQKLKASDPFKDNPYLNTLREKLQGVKSAMNDADTTSRRWLQTTQQLTEAQKKSVDEQMKLFYARTMKIPTDQYDMQIAKLERIQSLLQSYRRGDVSFTPAQLSGLEKEERTLLSIVGAHKEINQTQQQVASSTQQTVQYAHQYTEEIRRQAQAIRESTEYKAGKDVLVTTPSGYDAVINIKDRIAIEDKLTEAYQKHIGQKSELDRIEQTDNEVAKERLGTETAITNEISKRRRYSTPETQVGYDVTRDKLAQIIATRNNIERNQVVNWDEQASSIKTLSAALKQYQEAYAKMSATERNSPFGKQMIADMQILERNIQKFRQQMSRPIDFETVMNLPQKTLDDIAYKMRQLASYRSGLNVDTQKGDINTVNREYERLKKKMDEVMQKNNQMIASNNALGRSWNYMKNRLAFYFTVGASTQFIKNLIEVRSQYEMNEKALGILLDSASRGTRIFNELSQMSLVSPYTLIELSSAAKQLTAYDIAAKDVVDTTRRLADMASAVGVPVERLTYALGQIKAYGYLNSRDARMFANAGIPLVKQLADYYSELEGKMVSTADVYDRMKKKAIDYADVMKVVTKMTDEGGKFFDFQAKMADTLKVRLANLTLAWNNMLNELGKSNQGTLTTGIKSLTVIFRHWREIYRVLSTVIVALGAYKAATMLAGITTKSAIGASAAAWLSAAASIRSAKDAVTFFSMAVKSVPFAGWVTMIATLASYFYLFNNSTDGLKQKLEDIATAFDGVRKEITDLYADALKSDNIGSQLTKLRDILELAQTEMGVTIPINLEDVDESNIKQKLKEAKRFIDDYINFSQTFSEAAAGTKFNELMNEFGASARSTYTSISESINTVVVSLQQLDDKGKLAERGKQILDELLKGQKEDESRIEYLQRLIGLYEELGIIGKKETVVPVGGTQPIDNMILLQNKQEESLNRLGIKNKTVYENMLKDVQNYYSSSAIAQYQFEQQVERVAKKIDIDNIPVEQRTVKLSAAINKEASLNNWNQFEKEFARQIANKKFGTNIVISEESKGVAETELQEWQKRQQAWMDKNGINVKLNFQTNDTEVSYASRMLQAAKDAKEEVEVQQRKLAVGTGSQDAVDASKKAYENARILAKEAGADLEQLDKKANAAAKKAAKAAETELSKALKDELSTIEKVRSIYRELTKEGASHADAIKSATEGWEETVNAINRVLTKNGLKGLNLNDFVGVENPREILKTLQAQLDEMVKRGAKPAEIKVLQEKIKTIKVDAEKYDLTKITKGLNNELDRLKEEYELAVALDADPELGGIFADMFDINVDELPHSINEYAERVTNELNDAIKKRKDKIQLPTITGLTKDDIKAFREMSENGGLNVESFEEIEKAYKDFVSLRKKAATDVSKIASDYIREYGDLSAQIKQIETEKNDALMKLNEIYNTDALKQTQRYLDAKFAIEDGAKRKQAKATFDALKKESDYERFFTAIDTLTEKDALSIKNKIKKGIIDSFKNGGLTASQFRKEIKALEEQFDKLSQPTSNWISYLSGGFDKLIQRAKETGQEIETIGEKISITGKVDENDKNYLQSLGSIFNNGKGGNTDFSSLMSLFGKDMKGLGSNISEAGQGMQAGASGFAGAVTIVDAIIKNVHQTVQAIGSVIDELDSVRNEENKISNAYWEGFKKFDNYATSGWENLKSGNVAGAIADTANSIISIFNTFSNAKNEKINKEIKESERAIKRLELAYIDLEQAVEKAYGMATIGANMAAKANKELQLEELKRQLTLERSRDSKRRDEDKIVELKKQIKELEYDIADTVDSIVNDLLGISSVGDALENVMGNIIEAFRSGSYKLKDIMKDVKISFNDMIANMVMKMYTTKVLQPWFEEQWNTVQNQINERAGEIPNKLAEVQSKVSEAKIADLNDNDSIFEALRTLGMDNEQMLRLHFDTLFNKGGNAILRDAYEKALKEAEQKEAEIQKELTTATMPTTDDIKQYAELLRNGQPIVTDRLKEIESFLRELGLLNDKKETTLSALQAGISGITEDTAGALEAYMNGVSQQVYLQSDLLTQIRDAVFAFDLDVQVATMSQILLQLQSSYTVQMSIQGILEGVLNPSGRAFTVELVS